MAGVVIIGATSAIAQETARRFAADGAAFFLVARNPEKLRAVADDLSARGSAVVETMVLDVDDLDRHPEVRDRAVEALGQPDAVLIAHGALPDPDRCRESAEAVVACFTTNCVSVVSLATLFADLFEHQGKGTLAVISSVAGDRGRGSNYVYGAAKGGVDRFLEGLRNRLFRKGVRVVTIKPGFVDTPMTAGIPKTRLFADARSVGLGIHRAMLSGREVVYLPWFWRWIMLVIRCIPETVFKRLNL